MSSNDWGERMSREARSAMEREAIGHGSIAFYIRDHLMPYIGMRMQEGAIVWRPESDEVIADVIRDTLQAAGVASVRRVEKSSPEYTTIRNTQRFIRRAVNFYRAISLLTEKHGIAPEWNTGKTSPAFPLAWFVPQGHSMVHAQGVPTHSRISGKSSVLILTLKEGSLAPISVTVSEASILGLCRPPRAEGSGENGNTTTLQGALDAAASMLAKADNRISGEAADAFVHMLEAFLDAHPSNLALVAGMVEARSAKRAAA